MRSPPSAPPPSAMVLADVRLAAWLLLAAVVPGLEVDGWSNSGDVSPATSCMNDKVARADLPPELDQNYKPPECDFTCVFDVSWDHSEWMLATFEEFGADPDDYKFKVCWEFDVSPEERQFPWVFLAGSDWRFNLSLSGSVILHPSNAVDTWAHGFQNVMPDALEHFARMGEVAGRKIMPRFMLFGWSKGGGWIWPLASWRPDLVQGSVVLHACAAKSHLWTRNFSKKAVAQGVAPQMLGTSKEDKVWPCTYKDTTRRHKNASTYQWLTVFVKSPCGHHPDQCWPLCNYASLYVRPFWKFVERAQSRRQGCRSMNNQKQCEELLCLWDTSRGYCEETYPTRLSRSCRLFCRRSQVASCDGLKWATCRKSYKVLSAKEANANGHLSACEHVNGTCVQSPVSSQCFFQDQCPP